MPGHLAAGYFLPPQSELLRGLWLEKRCPALPPHPQLPLNLSVVERQGTTLYILGIGFNFLKLHFDNLFSAVSSGGKRVNEYLIKFQVSTWLPPFSFQLWALVAGLVKSGS